MRFIIYGAGAIGSIVGGRLAISGAEVVLVGRPAHVAAINQHGLLIKSAQEETRVKPDKLSAFADLTELHARADDVIFLCVKSAQTFDAVHRLHEVFPTTTPIFCLQNGIRNEGLAAERFLHSYAVMVEISATLLGPGEVADTRGDLFSLGNYPRGCDETALAVAAGLRNAGYRITTHEHALEVKWSKLLLNLNNATHAILDTYVQLSFFAPETRALMADVMEEGVRVLQAAGIKVDDPENPLHVLSLLDTLRNSPVDSEKIAAAQALPPALRTYPSTWVDIKQQRGAVETRYLNGEIILLGEKHHVPTPYNSTLFEIVEQMAAARDLPGKYTVTELCALIEMQQRAQTPLVLGDNLIA